MDNLKRINENYDQKGIAERQEQLVQQRMSAMLTTLYLARKELPYTKQRNSNIWGCIQQRVYQSWWTRG